ncbi:MAG: hypothetical protein OJJ54_17235 [Pseudonocardia sp.]|nr:hypothetical protein [Pseudonocardia sp.]
MRPDPRPGRRLEPAAAAPRRSTDRAESALSWAVGIGGLLALVVALVVGLELQASGTARARAEWGDRSVVTAVLQAPSTMAVGLDPTVLPVQRLPATWTGPDGLGRSGQVDVTGVLPAGAPVEIWIDRSGAVVNPPADALTVTTTAVIVGAFTFAVAGLLLMLLWIGGRGLIARRNDRAWAAEWALVEPAWSGRG